MADSAKCKILIYRLGSLGDTIVALPCFNKIKEVFPDADITLLTNKPIMAKAAPIEAVLGSEYFFNRVFYYPVGTRSPRLLYELLKNIRNLNIDTVINLTAARSKSAAIRDRLFFRAAGIKNLLGFPKTPADFLISEDIADGEHEWESKRLARRIRSLGALDLYSNSSWNMQLTKEELDEAQNLLKSDSNDLPIIAVCAGTKVQSKDWEHENWLKLIARLKENLQGWRLVLIGASEEISRAHDCLDVWGQDGLNLCGMTSPRVSAAILKQAAIFVGHDSGPMHLAACVGTPCVAIFAARNLPRQWFPRGENNKVLYHRTDCAGCGLEICIEQKKKCILSITVDEVEAAVMDILRIKV